MNLELHGKKLTVAIILATLALSALFLAQGATSLIAGALLPIDSAPATAGRKAPVKKLPGSDPPDPRAILARNIFDPTTGPLPKPEEPEVATEAPPAPPEPPKPGEIPPPCENTSLRLVAAVHSERAPEWSFATMTSGQGEPLLYREGGRFVDNDVFQILPKAVFLRQSNGHYCSLSLFGSIPTRAPESTPAVAGTSSPATPPAPLAAGVPTPGGISEAELNQNINAVSETKFAVPRTFVDKILQNQGEIMRSARIVPHEENGQVVGVKLYGIRRNSLLGKLGLQNGDLLRTINGFEMSSPDTALEAYSRLRSASNLSVAVTRRGRPMNIDYDIQ